MNRNNNWRFSTIRPQKKNGYLDFYPVQTGVNVFDLLFSLKFYFIGFKHPQQVSA